MMKSSNNQIPRPVSPLQCLALYVSFRRLLSVVGIFPLVVAAFPVIMGIYLTVADFLTSGKGFLSTIVTAVFVLFGIGAINLYAPTAKKRQEALSKSVVSLPLIALLVGQLFIRHVLRPIATWMNMSYMLTFSPKLPFMTACQISCSMMLLGSAILARFVGPVSVVQCSETLLRSHPVSASIRSFWTRCTSLDAFLGLVAAPSDKHGELVASSFSIWQENGLRYQRPSLRASVGQILLSTAIGFILPHTMPIWKRLSHDPMAQMVLTATCILTLLTHLMVTALDGSSHELDPKRYQSFHPQSILSLPSLGSAVVIVPAVAVAVVYHTDRENATSVQASTISLAFLALVITTLVSVYLILVNEISKMVLCYPGLDIKHAAKQFSDGNDGELSIMLASILQGSESLVKSVLEQTRKAGVLYLEDKELKRGELNKKAMAKVLLFMDRHLESTDARLERDVLCMLLLESLGGRDPNATGNAEAHQLSPRHEQVVKKWAHPKNAEWLGAARSEPSAVPLLRALCTYSGGLGEALLLVSLPPDAPERIALSVGSAQTSWLLPPGARACGEWAIQAASRLIVYSLESTTSQGPASDWRSTSLSSLIPVMLDAAFTLRKGALRFARVNQDKQIVAASTAVEIDWLAGDNKMLRPIVFATNEAAVSVLQALKSVDGGTQMNLPMSNDCRLWLEGLGGHNTT